MLVTPGSQRVKLLSNDWNLFDAINKTTNGKVTVLVIIQQRIGAKVTVLSYLNNGIERAHFIACTHVHVWKYETLPSCPPDVSGFFFLFFSLHCNSGLDFGKGINPSRKKQ